MKIMIIFCLGLVKESATFTVEMQQRGNPFLGSNNVQLSCIVKAEDDEIVDRILILSRLNGTNFKNVIFFDIQKNVTYIINPGGSYLTGRITLKNLLLSENRTVIEYNEITCEDNTYYRCDVWLTDYSAASSPVHSIKVKESTAQSTVELQQYGEPVMESNGFQLSCIVKQEENTTIDRIVLLSKARATELQNVIVFDIKGNAALILIPGSYLQGRVTLTDLISSENRTLVEYNSITCDDNTDYRCDIWLTNYQTYASKVLSIEVKAKPKKPDNIPIRSPDVDMCQGMNVNFTCSGNIGKPSGYFKWTKVSNGSTTIYNDTIDTDTEIPGTCMFNRTSILSIEAQKEDNNAIFRCEVIHELASEMYQQTIPEIFVYDHPYEYTVITKEPDRDYHDTTTPFIELTCFAHGCSLSNYTWYKYIDLNTTIGNDSLYRISNVTIKSSGNYICIVETIINGTEEKYNQTVTIDIRNPEQPEQLPIQGVGFADTAAGLATIAVVSVGGAVLTSIFLFKIIQKVKHLRMLKAIGVKDVEIVNNADPDNEATQGIDDEGFVSEVSQQWKNNAPIQSTM